MWPYGRATALTALFTLASCLPGLAQPRHEVSLNGTWQVVKVKDLTAPPPADGWRPIEVPGYLDGYNYERAWFKRTFEVPAAMAGARIALYFGGVKYNSTLYVNGQKVGGTLNGFVPFECDITDAARVGQENEVLVGLHDWTGVFKDNTLSLIHI